MKPKSKSIVEGNRSPLFYAQRGARFIRLDVIAYLWKQIGPPCVHLPETHYLVQLFRAVLDAIAPETMLITETNIRHEDDISYFDDGTNEAHMVYKYALLLIVSPALSVGNAQEH